MKAQQLKNSILQLAIQGKLVPQDDNDEPACELIKRDKNESYIFRRDNENYRNLENIAIINCFYVRIMQKPRSRGI